jgi:hypothetical protein
LNAIEAVGPTLKLIGELPKPPFSDIAAGLTSGSTIYLAHVRNNHHFVLLIDADGTDAFFVHDPFYPFPSYPYANISDIIMYSVQTKPWVNTPHSYPLFKQCDPVSFPIFFLAHIQGVGKQCDDLKDHLSSWLPDVIDFHGSQWL